MEHLFDYLEFLAKTVTVVAAILVIGAAMASSNFRRAAGDGGHIDVRHINDSLRAMKRDLGHALLPSGEFKKTVKQENKALAQKRKAERKLGADADRKRIFVLTFDGDLQASRVGTLRNEITAVLTTARPADEVVVRIESSGGMVHAYGLAASQLQRVRDAGIRLVAAVDKVAASGGYLMASAATHIIAAPFAVVGSIGVMAQVPNVHRLLKKHDVDVEVLTAGKFKRTLTVLGENTEQGRAKFMEELEDVHALFQDFVSTNRPALDIAAVATGESWYGRRALDRKLIDEVLTSDEYLMRACQNSEVFELKWVEHKKPIDRLMEKLTVLGTKPAQLAKLNFE